MVALGDDGPPEYMGNAEIRWIPFQKAPATVANWYRAADIYLHAARADTFPNTVIEALACGTPVVATAVGGISEQVDDGVTGLLAPVGDAAALADAVETLLRDERRLAAMGEAAAEAARGRYDVRAMVESYEAWLSELA